MKKRKQSNSIREFRKEKIQKQNAVKGGPEGSRGTTTTVQPGG